MPINPENIVWDDEPQGVDPDRIIWDDQEETGGRIPDVLDGTVSQELPPTPPPPQIPIQPVKVEPTEEDKIQADRAREAFDEGQVKIEKEDTPVEKFIKKGMAGTKIAAEKALPSLKKHLYSGLRMIGESIKSPRKMGLAGVAPIVMPEPAEGSLAAKLHELEEPVGKQLASWSKKKSGEIDDELKKIMGQMPEDLRGRLWDNPHYLLDPQWMIVNTGDAAVSFIPAVAAGIVGGPMAAGTVGGSMEGLDLYDQLINEGVEHNKAMMASTAFGIVTGILNAVGMKGILTPKEGVGFVRKILGHMGAGALEAGTEWAEEPFQAAFKGLAEEKSVPEITTDVLQSLKNVEVAVAAAITGTGGSVVAPKMQAVPGEEAPTPEKEIVPPPITEEPLVSPEITPEEEFVQRREEAEREAEEITAPIIEEAKVEPTPEVKPELEEVEKEFAGEINQVIDEVTQRGSITIERKEKTAPHSFTNKEVEERFQASKGVKKETFGQNARQLFTTIKNRATRTYENLPNKKEYAQLKNDLLLLSKQKGISSDKVFRALQGVTVRLDKNSFDLFSRKVILDDLAETAKKDMALPLGLTKETLATEKAKIDTIIATSPEVQDALERRGRLWTAIKNDYIRAMGKIGFDVSEKFKNENYFRHQVLEYANAKGITGVGRRIGTPAKRGFLKRRHGSQLDINTDYLQAEHEVMAQMLYDIQVAKVIDTVDQQHNIADQVRKDAKEQGIDDWRDAVPEGYILWQPREGNVFYMTDSIPSTLAQDLVNEQLRDLPVKSFFGEDQIRQVLALGGKRRQFVLKQEVADTLEGLTKPTIANPVSKASRTLLRGWKIWTLTSPRRWFKYNARNLTGDADALFAGNPKAFLKAPRAIKELYGIFVKDKVMTENLKDWFERGGMQSTLQAQEMGDINNLKIFKNFLDRKGNVKDVFIGLWKKYWKAARLSTDFREAILRYAAYLDYYESMQKSPDGKPKNFGASRPEEIMGLEDIKDRAFWLSNDLLGAYDKVSVFGKTLREYHIPFWSWKEVNFRRYLQLYKNAASDGKLMEQLGKSVFRNIAKTPYQALRLGKLTIKVLAVWGILQAWNFLRFPKEERELHQDVRNRPHLILGRDKNGNIIYFSRLGAVTDLLEWIGLDNSYEHIEDLLAGKKTLRDVGKDMAKSPVNTIINGVSPFYKIPAEILTKQSLFPDAFEPRTIRDEGLHIARGLGLENEYRELAGLPSRGYAESLDLFLWYKSDPGQTAYGDIMDEKRRFKKKLGKGGTGFWMTPRGNALYHMKIAVRYGDDKAAKKYLLKYIQMGGTKEGMERSFQAMNPLYGLNEKEREAFVGSLNKKDRKKLVVALKFYNDTLLGMKKETE